MRTTLDLPDDLLRQAKIVAVQRGTTLRELVRGALAQELGLASPSRSRRRRVKFPIFASSAPGSLDLTAVELSRDEAAEDARRHGHPA